MQIKFEGGDAIKNPELMPVIPYNGKGITTYGNVVVEDGIATGFDGSTSYLKADLGFRFDSLNSVILETPILFQIKYFSNSNDSNGSMIMISDLTTYGYRSVNIQDSYGLRIIFGNDYFFFDSMRARVRNQWNTLQMKLYYSNSNDILYAECKLLDGSDTVISSHTYTKSGSPRMHNANYFVFGGGTTFDGQYGQTNNIIDRLDLNETFIKRLDTDEVLTQWIRK
jgi:hypothetical protein